MTTHTHKNGYLIKSDSLSWYILILLHSEWPKLYGVLTILSAIGLKFDEFLYIISAEYVRLQKENR